jgi:leader peptidase (prepilin peptidase)/N-methyltransferase
MDAFLVYPWLFPGLFTIFGLIIGSFLNVVIYRLPQIMFAAWKQEFAENFPEYEIALPEKSLSLSLPHSHCPYCHHPIQPWHNIPVLSWLLLRGRCAYCHHSISIQYPIVEALTAVTSYLIASHFGVSMYTFAIIALTYLLITAALIDLNHMLLPDALTQPMMWLGIICSLLQIGPVTLHDSVVGTLAGYLSLWSVYWLFKLLTKKEGMGYGDFKLLAALGAWLGWQLLPIVILIASLAGTLFGVVLIIVKKNSPDRSFPFGPSLAISGWICLLWGQTIIDWYLSSLLGG